MVRALGLTLAMGCTAGEDGVNLDGSQGSEDASCVGAEPFVAGVSKQTPGGLTVAITSATPTPPDVGDNTWTVEITDASGAPVEALSPSVEPWMPLHAHGLTPPTYAGADVGGGTYEVELFDLVMPGLWEFRFDLGAGDEALFQFCAEG